MTESPDTRVLEVIADVLGVDTEQLTPEVGPDNVAGWDSVQHLNLMLAIEQAFGVELDPTDIEAMQTVGAILDVVRRKSA